MTVEDHGFDLPKLQGSEKQVVWAYNIRLKVARSFRSLVLGKYDYFQQELGCFADQCGIDDEDLNPIIERSAGEVLSVHTASKFWIDNREDIDNVCLREFRDIVIKKVVNRVGHRWVSRVRVGESKVEKVQATFFVCFK